MPQRAQRDLSHLFERNIEWTKRKTRDDPGYFTRMVGQQRPNYLWIGCSDSRVTANDILNLDPGEVFVHRNIANIAHSSDMNLLAVLEYAVNVLHVQHIIICGHYNCGGIERALGDERNALVDYWLQPIVMLYRKHNAAFTQKLDRRAQINRLCEINIEMQVRRVATTPIVENAWLQGAPLHIHGWIYNVEDGILRNIAPTLSSREERDQLMTIDERVLQMLQQ